MDLASFVTEPDTWMLRLAYLLTGSRTAAEDLCQDALVKVVTSQRRVFAARHPKAYVRRIIVNCHRDQQRSQEIGVARFDAITVVVDDRLEQFAAQVRMWQSITQLTAPIRTANCVALLRGFGRCRNCVNPTMLTFNGTRQRLSRARTTAALLRRPNQGREAKR